MIKTKIIIQNFVIASLNEYLVWHWGKRARYKKDLGWLLIEAGAKKIKFQGKVKISIIQFTSKKFKDYDNFVGGCKLLIDNLVDFETIWGDKIEDIGCPSYGQAKENFCELHINIKEVKQ